MLKNLFKVAVRNFARQRGSALLNVLGLAIGLSAAILIFLYLQEELSYDTVHVDPAHTYGIAVEVTDEQGEKNQYGSAPAGWAVRLKEQFPEVEAIFRYIAPGFPHSIRNQEEDKVLLTQDGEIFWVEETFAQVMHFPLLYGNAKEAFAKPNTMVLSERAAQRIFGETNVVGKRLEVKHIWMTDGQYADLEVTGVMEDYPTNSHIRPDYLLNLQALKPFMPQTFGITIDEYLNSVDNGFITTYIRTQQGTDMNKLEASLEKLMGNTFVDQGFQVDPFFVKLTDFHFDEQVDWTFTGGADYDYIFVFGSIGLMILLIACVNYMNLATARASRRCKEVGVRKSLGSNRFQLMYQFFQESLLTTLVALLVALLLAMLMLNIFNNLADKSFTVASLFQPQMLLALLVIWLVVSVVAGSYPAVFLSGFKPTEVLKGKVSAGKGPARFRQVLVVGQFTISVFLIISTGVVLQQMRLLQSSKLFESATQMLSIRYGGGIVPESSYPVLRQEILKDPDLAHVTLANHLPRLDYFGPIDVSVIFPDINNEQVWAWKELNGDYFFPAAFDMEFVAGRTFDEQNPADSNNYILNETAVRHLNKSPEEILGYAVMDTATDESGRVIGVVKDFPYESIHTTIQPMMIQGRPHPSNQILYVRLPSDQIQEKIASLESIWKEVLPGIAFDYWFVSDEFGRMYQSEMLMADLVQTFSILAVLIACLGLYGLASYTAEQKTKEIGIRKVMGATVEQVLFMLLLIFLKIMLIACLISLPLGYWLMHSWLQNFVYRIDIGWGILAFSVVILLVLTIVTVSYQTLKASTLQPAASLRYE